MESVRRTQTYQVHVASDLHMQGIKSHVHDNSNMLKLTTPLADAPSLSCSTECGTVLHTCSHIKQSAICKQAHQTHLASELRVQGGKTHLHLTRNRVQLTTSQPDAPSFNFGTECGAAITAANSHKSSNQSDASLCIRFISHWNRLLSVAEHIYIPLATRCNLPLLDWMLPHLVMALIMGQSPPTTHIGFSGSATPWEVSATAKTAP